MKKTKVFFCGITSTNIAQDAERAITKANPPMSRQEAGEVGGRGKKVVTPKDDLISQSNLRNMRQAHTNLSDTEYSEIKSDSIPTRKNDRAW